MSGYKVRSLGCYGFYGYITLSKFGRSSRTDGVVELQFPAEIGEVIAKSRGIGCNAGIIADIVGGGRSKGSN